MKPRMKIIASITREMLDELAGIPAYPGFCMTNMSITITDSAPKTPQTLINGTPATRFLTKADCASKASFLMKGNAAADAQAISQAVLNPVVKLVNAVLALFSSMAKQ
jgi:hypothetical protein